METGCTRQFPCSRPCSTSCPCATGHIYIYIYIYIYIHTVRYVYLCIYIYIYGPGEVAERGEVVVVIASLPLSSVAKKRNVLGLLHPNRSSQLQLSSLATMRRPNGEMQGACLHLGLFNLPKWLEPTWP